MSHPRDTMRDMTHEELRQWYRLRWWPCCGTPRATHVRGPAGGASVNLECIYCDMRVNVMDPDGPYSDVEFGQVIREPRDGGRRAP